MKDLRIDISKKRLFLVCPTDHMEQVIHKKFGGKAFFYTALGAYFEFDTETQYHLWDMICELGIDEVLLVTRINNNFYGQAFEHQRKHTYPVNKSLSKIKEEITSHQMSAEIFLPNFYLLAARHIANQKKCLLLTYYLGDHLLQQGISVKACAYHPGKDVFYSLEELEHHGGFLKNISCN